MRRRHRTIFLAFLAVLLHAGFVAQHNAVVLAAKLSKASDTAEFGVICHGGSEHAAPVVPAPADPDQKSNWGFCPLCAAAGSAAAILCQIVFDVERPVAASVRIALHDEPDLVRIVTLRPPPRGPPAVG